MTAPAVLSRRSVLWGLAGVLAVGAGSRSALAQAKRPLRLMVLRRPALLNNNQCGVPCIRGRVYDVSSTVKGDDFSQVVLPGLIQQLAICDVIERAWADDKPESSIRQGVYRATLVRSPNPEKKWMYEDPEKKQKPIPHRAWRLLFEGTEPRTGILFHYGKDQSWSKGCLIVGQATQSDPAPGNYCKLTNPDAGMKALMAHVDQPGNDTRDVMVCVTDFQGLFPSIRSVRC